MIAELIESGRFGWAVLGAGAALAVFVWAGVIVERAYFGLQQASTRRFERRYGPLVRRAVDGDAAAVGDLVASPWRHRIVVATLLITPLIDDRDPGRITRTRAVVTSLSVLRLVDRYLRSYLWWRRALALRAVGLLQAEDYAPAIVAALDDSHPDVRAAALDALADLQSPRSLRAVVVRMQDVTLPRGRRAAAVAAFGARAEPLVLELASIDEEHRASYARALSLCGTEHSRPVLSEWTADPRPDVRSAALQALARTGLDRVAATRAIAALEDPDASVRAMAASALRGWPGHDAVAHLARHVDDVWPVAVRAADALRSIQPDGVAALKAIGARSDLAGRLARQMIWEDGALW